MLVFLVEIVLEYAGGGLVFVAIPKFYYCVFSDV